MRRVRNKTVLKKTSLRLNFDESNSSRLDSFNKYGKSKADFIEYVKEQALTPAERMLSVLIYLEISKYYIQSNFIDEDIIK